MSTVEIEFQNAECPMCGVEALEFFDRYLRPEEVVEMCNCYYEPEYTRGLLLPGGVRPLRAARHRLRRLVRYRPDPGGDVGVPAGLAAHRRA